MTICYTRADSAMNRRKVEKERVRRLFRECQQNIGEANHLVSLRSSSCPFHYRVHRQIDGDSALLLNSTTAIKYSRC